MAASGWDNDAFLLDLYPPEDRSAYENEFGPLLERFDKQCAGEREEVLAAGGLYVLGTERHESRRIDNQLRGRSGRQGDPGESRFYLSLEDDLMRLFASDRIAALMGRMKIPDDVPIEAKLVSRAIERAQTQVESMNFEIRKNVLKYDEVMDKQRQIIYAERRQILEGEDFHDQALDLVREVLESAVSENASSELYPEEWDWDQLVGRMREIYPTSLTPSDFDPAATSFEEVVERFVADGLDYYARREKELGAEQLRAVERAVLLAVIDNRWREHLYEMDYLQEGIGLRAMGQRDPLVEYQREGFDMFVRMQEVIKEDFARYMFHVEAVSEDEARRSEPSRVRQERRQIPLAGVPAPGDTMEEDVEGDEVLVEQAVSNKVPRNAPCPCGSGKKYKQCHGRPGAVGLS